MEAAPELALHGMVIINTVIPEDALSAGLLGTNRAGHGVVIREDGLILTIGYLVSDAESVWITTRSGSTVPGYAVAYDHESGLGLVRATMPLSAAVLDLDDALEARIGDRAYIADSGPEGELHPTRIIARHEFAGRWEYVIDDAIFAAPSHQSWAGAALLNPQGRVMGIGSLLVQTQHEGESGTSANMFV
ncbi:MAG: trypsin-like peptidase domain-containing protein, partial [Gammaproteobacteria bacterium]|nr:trypsin-like peptidase domain-containing protein [Gammaproteobacteria bacterium]